MEATPAYCDARHATQGTIANLTTRRTGVMSLPTEASCNSGRAD
jgi:hypothetical protein